MILFVVLGKYDGELIGIFSTRQLAEERISKYHFMSQLRLVIEEVKLDEM